MLIGWNYFDVNSNRAQHSVSWNSIKEKTQRKKRIWRFGLAQATFFWWLLSKRSIFHWNNNSKSIILLLPFLLQTLYKQSFFLTLKRSVETYYQRALLLLVLPSFLSFCLFNYWRACYLSQGNQYGAAVALSLLTRLCFSLYPACPNRHTNTYLVRLCSKSLFVNLFLCSTSVNFICFFKCNLNTYPQTSLFVYLFLYL